MVIVNNFEVSYQGFLRTTHSGAVHTGQLVFDTMGELHVPLEILDQGECHGTLIAIVDIQVHSLRRLRNFDGILLLHLTQPLLFMRMQFVLVVKTLPALHTHKWKGL